MTSNTMLLALILVVAMLSFASAYLVWGQVARNRRDYEMAEKAERDAVTWRIGATILHGQIRGEGLAPYWELPANGDPPKYDALVGAMIEHFDIAELEALAFDVGIQWESLGGEGLSVRAIRLAQCAKRRGLDGELRAAILKARPKVKL